MLRDLWYSLRTVLRRRSVEDDLDDEVRFHLDLETAKHVDQGVPPAEARRRARLEFGQLDGIKKDCRQAWGLRLLDELGQDVRVGVRTLLRHRGFAVSVILTLAIGIGANVAVFSVVHAVLIRPFAYPAHEPERVLLMAERSAQNGRMGVSYLTFVSDRTKRLEAVSRQVVVAALAARGESPAAFDRRCIPPTYVASRSNTAGIFPRRALVDRRITGLGATRDFHHGLLASIPGQPDHVKRNRGWCTKFERRGCLNHVCVGGRAVRDRATVDVEVLEQLAKVPAGEVHLSVRPFLLHGGRDPHGGLKIKRRQDNALENVLLGFFPLRVLAGLEGLAQAEGNEQAGHNDRAKGPAGHGGDVTPWHHGDQRARAT